MDKKELIAENERLRRDIKHYERLVSSKRFIFANKIADSYNQFFPLNTKRRAVVSKIAHKYAASHAKKQAEKAKRYAEKLTELSQHFDKIMVLNSIPYDTTLKQRPHHLAIEFAKLGYFVIYLETENPVHSLRKINDNLVTINSYKIIKALNAKEKYFLTPNNMSTTINQLREIHSWGFKIIYDYLDEFHEDIAGELSIQLTVWDHLLELSPVLGLATAKKLQKHLENHLKTSCPVIMASNAVNVEHFDYTKQKNTIPEDLKSIAQSRKPIIGFYGALAPWIDFKLINATAKHHPEWEIVLIGMDYGGAMSALKPAKNIHYLGVKTYDQLAKYASFFNCAIIPFCTGDIAKATSPVKLFEYMAAGLPTVCTKDLDECKGYNYVYMAKDAADFEKKISIALEAYTDPAARASLLAEAKQNTWAKRASTIDEALKATKSK